MHVNLLQIKWVSYTDHHILLVVIKRFLHPYIPLFQVSQDMAWRHQCAKSVRNLQPFFHLWRSHSFSLGKPPKSVVQWKRCWAYYQMIWLKSLFPHTWKYLLMHIITKYDSSSSISCILFLINIHKWCNWETQYLSTGTPLDSIPLNVSPSCVSNERQKAATLIQSSMQHELRLRYFLVVGCKR